MCIRDRSKYEVDNTTSSYLNHNNDKVFWRYADALLLAAEAKVRMGQSGDAEVNEIRDRVQALSLIHISIGVRWLT